MEDTIKKIIEKLKYLLNRINELDTKIEKVRGIQISFPTQTGDTNVDVSSKEDKANKATDFTVVDNTKYPSTKAVKTELDKKENKANKTTTIRDAATADDIKFPTEKAVRTLFEAIKITGVYKGSASTYANLPAGENGDWAILNADDGDNKRGVYVTDGTNYSLAIELADLLELTETDVQNKEKEDYGLINPKMLWKYFKDIQIFLNENEANGKEINGSTLVFLIDENELWLNKTTAITAFDKTSDSFTEITSHNDIIIHRMGTDFNIENQMTDGKKRIIPTLNDITLTSTNVDIVGHRNGISFPATKSVALKKGSVAYATLQQNGRVELTIIEPEKKDPVYSHIVVEKSFTGSTLPTGIRKNDMVLSLDTNDVYVSNGDDSFTIIDKSNINNFASLIDKTTLKKYRFDAVNGVWNEDSSAGLMQELPITDDSIVEDQWSDNDLGIDLFNNSGYLIVQTMWEGSKRLLPPLRIELPMISGAEYHSGAAHNGNYSKIRARAYTDNPTILKIAGSWDNTSDHATTLKILRWYK